MEKVDIIIKDTINLDLEEISWHIWSQLNHDIDRILKDNESELKNTFLYSLSKEERLKYKTIIKQYTADKIREMYKEN